MTQIENLILVNQTVIMKALSDMVSDKLSEELQNCINITNKVIEGDSAIDCILSDDQPSDKIEPVVVEAGKTYGYGKLARTVTRIDRNTIYYTKQTGKEFSCWITTFEDWAIKQERERCKKMTSN